MEHPLKKVCMYFFSSVSLLLIHHAIPSSMFQWSSIEDFACVGDLSLFYALSFFVKIFFVYFYIFQKENIMWVTAATTIFLTNKPTAKMKRWGNLYVTLLQDIQHLVPFSQQFKLMPACGSSSPLIVIVVFYIFFLVIHACGRGRRLLVIFLGTHEDTKTVKGNRRDTFHKSLPSGEEYWFAPKKIFSHQSINFEMDHSVASRMWYCARIRRQDV